MSYSGNQHPPGKGLRSKAALLLPVLLSLAGVDPSEGRFPLDGRPILKYGTRGDLLVNEGEKEVFLYANPGWPPSDQPWTPEGVRDEYRPWKKAGGSFLAFEEQIIGIRKGKWKLLQRPGETGPGDGPDADGYVLVNLEADPGEKSNLSTEERVLKEEMKHLLHAGYEDIYASPHSFEMPVFRLGQGNSPVLFYAPQQISEGLKNASFFLRGFSSETDSALYLVDVEKPGSYLCRIYATVPEGSTGEFLLKAGEEQHAFSLEPDQNEAPSLVLDLESGRQELLLRAGKPTDESIRFIEMNLEYLNQ